MIHEGMIPTVDSVVEINNLMVVRYGGKPSITPPKDCVDGAIHGAANATYYMCGDEELDFLIFASNVLFQLAKTRHCFTDGNKRTAWVIAVEVFYKNNIGIEATEQEAEDMVLNVVSGQMILDEIIEWFADRIRPLD